jgi:ABC-type sugar transport system permease subunit
MPDSTLVAPPVTATRREHRLAKSALGPAFCSPLVLLFLLLVIAPILYMLYMGMDGSIYPPIFADPIFVQTLWITIVFVGLAVNIKMFLSLLLSITRPGIS